MVKFRQIWSHGELPINDSVKPFVLNVLYGIGSSGQTLTGPDPIKILRRKFYTLLFFKHFDWQLKMVKYSRSVKFTLAPMANLINI